MRCLALSSSVADKATIVPSNFNLYTSKIGKSPERLWTKISSSGSNGKIMTSISFRISDDRINNRFPSCEDDSRRLLPPCKGENITNVGLFSLADKFRSL